MIRARTIPQWSLVSIVTDTGIEGTYVTKPWVGTEIRNRFSAEKERIIGLDPLNRSTVENMWKGFPYMMNPANANVLGTLEICLWDIAGKYFKVPVTKLLGQKKESHSCLCLCSDLSCKRRLHPACHRNQENGIQGSKNSSSIGSRNGH